MPINSTDINKESILDKLRFRYNNELEIYNNKYPNIYRYFFNVLNNTYFVGSINVNLLYDIKDILKEDSVDNTINTLFSLSNDYYSEFKNK